MPRNSVRLTALGTLWMLGGCSSDDPVTPEPVETADRVVFVAIQADLGSLNQHFASGPLDGLVSDSLSLDLFRARFEGGRLVYTAGLAKHWARSPDGREFTLQLRDDSTWQDGQPVRAQDVVFTFGVLADPAAGSQQAGAASEIEPHGVRAVDEHTVLFRTTQAMRLDQVQSQLAEVVILPEHLLASTPAAELREHGFNQAPVLNGCWALEAWEPGVRISLAARPWGHGADACAPQLDRVEFRVIPDYASRLTELREGRLDVVTDLRVRDLTALVPEHPELGFHRRGPRSLVYVGWNLRTRDGSPHPLLGDPRVRRAMAQAVDVDAIVRDLYQDPSTGETFAVRAVGSISPALEGMSGKGIVPLGYDPASARTTLEALGWRDGDGDGVLDRQGVPFRIELLSWAGDAPWAEAGARVQADLAQVGIAVDITAVGQDAWLDRAGRGDFDALLGSWDASLYIEPAKLWHSGPDADRNWTGYANPSVDALIERGMAARSPEAAVSTWQAMQATVYQDQPYLFLYWADEIVAVHRRISGMEVGLAAPWNDLEQWSLVGGDG